MYERDATFVVISTSVVAFLSGFMLGIYSIRGYLISPELRKESRANYDDPVDSDETDIDEDEAGPLDHAPNWANGEEADRRQGLRQSAKDDEKKKKGGDGKATRAPAPAPAGPVVEDTGEECKLVLAVRTDLGMTKGKIAAQCGHATLACYKAISKTAHKAGPASPEAKILSRWERAGQAKVALQVRSQDELTELMGVARSLGLTAEVIADAGRTQIDPGSLTVLGVGPAPKSIVDKVTGQLKLL